MRTTRWRRGAGGGGTSGLVFVHPGRGCGARPGVDPPRFYRPLMWMPPLVVASSTRLPPPFKRPSSRRRLFSPVDSKRELIVDVHAAIDAARGDVGFRGLRELQLDATVDGLEPHASVGQRFEADLDAAVGGVRVHVARQPLTLDAAVLRAGDDLVRDPVQPHAAVRSARLHPDRLRHLDEVPDLVVLPRPSSGAPGLQPHRIRPHVLAISICFRTDWAASSLEALRRAQPGLRPCRVGALLDRDRSVRVLDLEPAAGRQRVGLLPLVGRPARRHAEREPALARSDIAPTPDEPGNRQPQPNSAVRALRDMSAPPRGYIRPAVAAVHQLTSSGRCRGRLSGVPPASEPGPWQPAACP